MAEKNLQHPGSDYSKELKKQKNANSYTITKVFENKNTYRLETLCANKEVCKKETPIRILINKGIGKPEKGMLLLVSSDKDNYLIKIYSSRGRFLFGVKIS